jgi:hypothetical protein
VEQIQEIGAWLKINDTKTGEPAVKNPFYLTQRGGHPDYGKHRPFEGAGAAVDPALHPE